MKTTLWVLLFLCASALFAEVLFYDNFNRTNGVVGNSWTNISSATNTIENNALKIVSPNGTGIKHDLTPVSSGVVYIQYDWKVVSTGWYADAFPTGLITHLTTDGDGNLSYDLDGTMISPTILQNIGLGMYATIRLKIDLDADLFSVWINNVLAAENIAGNAVSSFSSFTFRGLGASTVQYVDNFMLFNGTAPSGFTATGSLNDIALSWNASSYPEALSYRIYRETASPSTSLLTELPGTASGYTDSTAQPNTDYYYRIKAVQAEAVETDFSPELMAHLQPQIAVTPQNITFNVGYGYSDSTYVTISNNGSYSLQWVLEGIVPSLGLVGYYPFNGDAADLSINSSNGVVHNAILTNDRFGNSDSAYYFDGENDNISFLDLFPLHTSHDATVSFWMKRMDMAKRTMLFSRIDPPETNRFHFYTGETGQGFEIDYRPPDGSIRIYSGEQDFTSPMQRWENIVVRRINNQYYLFRNGVLEKIDIDTDTFLPTSIGWTLGSCLASHSGDFFGSLDDVCLYDRALTDDEVISMYSNDICKYLSVSMMGGTTFTNAQSQFLLKVDTISLEIGMYIDTLYVNSNDPVNPIIPIVITTNVLPPNPVITPEPLVVNLNVDNPIRVTQFQLSNVGQGKLVYSLSGTDDLGIPGGLPSIPDFSPMGIHNGHSYYRSNNTMLWHDAKSLCEQKGGHLVTIATESENTFVYENTLAQSFIGFTDEVEEGVWRWVTDESVTYTSWHPGEPSNSGIEDWGEIRDSYPPYLAAGWNWNDATIDSYSYAVLEFDYLLPSSIISFSPTSSVVGSLSSISTTVTASGSHLDDGVYTTSINISAEGGVGPWYFPVTVNVDYTPPLIVSGLAVDPASTNDDQIGITWFANAIADSVVSYKIYRRGADETVWQLKATVPATQLAYVDSDFGDFVDTYQYYRVRAVDWVGNISAVGDSVMGALDRFLNPENIVIQNINNRDIHLSWDPVTETISGLPGAPTCYVIYKSQYPSPITDFDFLTISFTNEFTHQWALHFQPLNRLFYVVTAYGGDMGRMDALVAEKREWKYGELESRLRRMGKVETK